jgi:hypothetical protein
MSPPAQLLLPAILLVAVTAASSIAPAPDDIIRGLTIGGGLGTLVAYAGRPYKMTAAKLRLATASMGNAGTNVGELCAELEISRQTLYRHVSPTGEGRPDGLKLLASGRKVR